MRVTSVPAASRPALWRTYSWQVRSLCPGLALVRVSCSYGEMISVCSRSGSGNPLAKIGTIIMAAGASAEVVTARLTKIGTIIMAAGASAEVVTARLTKIGTKASQSKREPHYAERGDSWVQGTRRALCSAWCSSRFIWDDLMSPGAPSCAAVRLVELAGRECECRGVMQLG